MHALTQHMHGNVVSVVGTIIMLRSLSLTPTVDMVCEHDSLGMSLVYISEDTRQTPDECINANDCLSVTMQCNEWYCIFV